jgi:hypothetical protein
MDTTPTNKNTMDHFRIYLPALTQSMCSKAIYNSDYSNCSSKKETNDSSKIKKFAHCRFFTQTSILAILSCIILDYDMNSQSVSLCSDFLMKE